jgi:CHAD domain-containing protein
METKKESIPEESVEIEMGGEIPEENRPTEQQVNDTTIDRSSIHLCALTLSLFDKTRPLHALKKSNRQVLEYAALYHDISLPKGKKRPHRAVRKALARQIDTEISSDDLNLLAALVAYHRGRIKRKEIARLELSPMQQRAALTLEALLRIAIGLSDSGRHQTVIQQVELESDKVWIVIDGEQAASDAVVAQHKANLWFKIGYPKVKVLDASEAEKKLLPYPEPTDQIGMESSEALAEAARKVMRFHFARMIANEESTRLGEDIEALHDMRVATRRLRAAFEVFGTAFEPGVLKGYLKGLRKTGRALGRVRDIDVFLEKTQNYIDGLAEDRRESLELVNQKWYSRRERARAKMLAYLDSPDYLKFKREFNIFLNTPRAGARRIPADQPVPYQVCELAPILIYSRLAAVRAYENHLEDASLELLHSLRIEFKRLRYSVEYFKEVLGEAAVPVIEVLKIIQDHLGDLNDAQVAKILLKKFIESVKKKQKKLPEEERQSLDEIVAYRNARRDERQQLLNSFPEAWAQFDQPEFRQNLAQAIAEL